MIEITLGKIASEVRGELRGSADISIKGIKPVESAGSGELTFLEPAALKKQPGLREAARHTAASAIIVSEYDPAILVPQLVVEKPMAAVVRLAHLFYQPPQLAAGIHPTAVVAESTKIDNSASVGAYVVIGEDCVLGERCQIHPHVVIYEGAEIGARAVIHAGAVIRERVRIGSDCLIQNGVVVGGDGFGYIPDAQLGHRRIPHLGTVVLAEQVDLGANMTIDRAMLGETSVGRSTKIDNLVMIGHNTKIGERSLLCGQVGISGSCVIGNDVTLAGQAGVADHTVIGDKVRAGGSSAIGADIPANTDVMGYPAMPAGDFWRQTAVLRKLVKSWRGIQGFLQSLSGKESD